MSIFLLSFELNQKDPGSQLEIENNLTKFDCIIRISQTAWLIETELSTAQVLNLFEDYYDSDDNVFIFELTSNWEASASFDQMTWIESRL